MLTVKWMALLSLIGFTAYTLYCVRTENFWKSVKEVFKFRWGRQVTIDLYLGLLLFTFFIYLHEGVVLITLMWLVPTLIFGNIVPLIYFVWHFEAIISHFM